MMDLTFKDISLLSKFKTIEELEKRRYVLKKMERDFKTDDHIQRLKKLLREVVTEEEKMTKEPEKIQVNKPTFVDKAKRKKQTIKIETRAEAKARLLKLRSWFKEEHAKLKKVNRNLARKFSATAKHLERLSKGF